MHRFLKKRIEPWAKLGPTGRSVLFGIVSGLIWSVVVEVFVLSALSDKPDTWGGLFVKLGSGVAAGVIVALLLKSLLSRSGPSTTIICGLLSLPVGAFLYGFLLALMQMLANTFTGVGGTSVSGLNPVEAGVVFAGVSCVSFLSIFFLPAAVITTFLLRTFIIRGLDHNRAT
jgi:hypothetical protein